MASLSHLFWHFARSFLPFPSPESSSKDDCCQNSELSHQLCIDWQGHTQSDFHSTRGEAHTAVTQLLSSPPKLLYQTPKTTKLSDCQMPPVSVLSATATGYRAITSFSAC